jgi:hypothetical protein|tara:strand:- start:4525 stop:4824 length:300 start_codon:yes stop_codon:yes gene_type:complete
MDVEVTREFCKTTGRTLYHVTASEVRTEPFTIGPDPKGFAGFAVTTPKGSLPKALEGNFTRLDSAISHVKQYLGGMPTTQAAHREGLAKDRAARKAKEE